MRDYVAAIDQGTTGTRCILFDLEGRAAGSAYREHRQIFPQPGWVEHDPLEIQERVDEVIFEALRAAAPGRVLAVGITNQRETVVAWDARDGRPASNAIVWQDTRTAPECRAAIERGWEADVRARSGLPISTYFSATKIRWLLDHVGGVAELARSGDLMLGTIDTWVIWNLTGGPRGGAHVTDPTNASRTLLCNLASLEWDPALFERFGVPWGTMPQIRPSIAKEPYGFTAADGPFGARIPVCGNLGDQQAALVGQACFAAGEAKNTYGTGSFLLEHVGGKPVASSFGLLATAACAGPGEPAYALEGSVAVSGAAVQWLRDSLGLIASAAETESIAASVPDAGGVYFVPAFSGLFAPHWDMQARGAIVGLTRFAHARAPGAGDARSDLLPEPRGRRGHGGRQREAALGSEGRRRRERQRLPDAAPGRRPRHPRRAPRRERDDRPRRGLRGGPGGGRVRVHGCAAPPLESRPHVRAAMERRTAASRPSTAGSGRSSARGAGSRRAAARDDPGARFRVGGPSGTRTQDHRLKRPML